MCSWGRGKLEALGRAWAGASTSWLEPSTPTALHAFSYQYKPRTWPRHAVQLSKSEHPRLLKSEYTSAELLHVPPWAYAMRTRASESTAQVLVLHLLPRYVDPIHRSLEVVARPPRSFSPSLWGGGSLWNWWGGRPG